MFRSRFMPCAECGASVERGVAPVHRCQLQRLVAYQLFALRESVAGFEHQFRDFQRTATGRFETWLAARDVRTSAG